MADNKAKERIMAMLACVGVFAPIILVAVLIYRDHPVDPLAAGFIGTIVGSYITVFGYYFGSSSGSKDKQDTIDKMTAVASANLSPEQLQVKKEQWQKLCDTKQTTLSFEEWIKTPDGQKPII